MLSSNGYDFAESLSPSFVCSVIFVGLGNEDRAHIIHYRQRGAAHKKGGMTLSAIRVTSDNGPIMDAKKNAERRPGAGRRLENKEHLISTLICLLMRPVSAFVRLRTPSEPERQRVLSVRASETMWRKRFSFPAK